MPKLWRAHPLPGETEFNGTMGRSTTGVPEKRLIRSLSARDQARLARISDPRDLLHKVNYRVFKGETPQRTPRQVEGDLRA